MPSRIEDIDESSSPTQEIQYADCTSSKKPQSFQMDDIMETDPRYTMGTPDLPQTPGTSSKKLDDYFKLTTAPRKVLEIECDGVIETFYEGPVPTRNDNEIKVIAASTQTHDIEIKNKKNGNSENEVMASSESSRVRDIELEPFPEYTLAPTVENDDKIITSSSQARDFKNKGKNPEASGFIAETSRARDLEIQIDAPRPVLRVTNPEEFSPVNSTSSTAFESPSTPPTETPEPRTTAPDVVVTVKQLSAEEAEYSGEQEAERAKEREEAIEWAVRYDKNQQGGRSMTVNDPKYISFMRRLRKDQREMAEVQANSTPVPGKKPKFSLREKCQRYFAKKAGVKAAV